MGESSWLSDAEQRAWRGYRLMSRQLEARLARELGRDADLSMQDYDVLSCLTEVPSRRWCAKDLGEYLLWSPSRLSHHLDRMQRRGLVDRVQCPDGRGRAVDVALTPAGEAALRRAAPGHVAAVRKAFIDHVTDQDLATLERLSSTVRHGLRDSDDN